MLCFINKPGKITICLLQSDAEITPGKTKIPWIRKKARRRKAGPWAAWRLWNSTQAGDAALWSGPRGPGLLTHPELHKQKNQNKQQHFCHCLRNPAGTGRLPEAWRHECLWWRVSSQVSSRTVMTYFKIFLALVLKQGLAVWAQNSLGSQGWPWTQASCLGLLRAEITGTRYYP